MNDHSGRFINDKDVIVFIGNVDRDVLALRSRILGYKTCESQGDHIAGRNFVIRFRHGAIDHQIA